MADAAGPIPRAVTTPDESASETRRAGRAGFARFAARDAAIVAGSLVLWWLLAARSAGAGAVADFTGFVAGLAVGATAFVLHEWGHLLAAFAARATVVPGRRLGAPFIFGFDSERNTLAQFLVMSAGGFAATAVIVWSFYVHLPDGLLATHVARGAALFLAFLGVTLELPLVGVALHARRVPAAVDVAPRRRPRVGAA
jgi:hypothetical protein